MAPQSELARRRTELRADIAQTPVPEALATFGPPRSYRQVAGQVIELLQFVHDHPDGSAFTEEQVRGAERVYTSLATGQTRTTIQSAVERALRAWADGHATGAAMDAGQQLTFGYHVLQRSGYGEHATEVVDAGVRDAAGVPQLPDPGDMLLGGLRAALDVQEKLGEARARGEAGLQAACSALVDVFLRRTLKLSLLALAGLVSGALGGRLDSP